MPSGLWSERSPEYQLGLVHPLHALVGLEVVVSVAGRREFTSNGWPRSNSTRGGRDNRRCGTFQLMEPVTCRVEGRVLFERLSEMTPRRGISPLLFEQKDHSIDK